MKQIMILGFWLPLWYSNSSYGGCVPFVIITTRYFPHSWLRHRICNKCNTTGTTCGAGTAYPSRAPDFTGFKWCSLFVFFILGIVLSVHRFAASEYTLWYLQTLHIHNTEQICFQLFVTRGILLIIELENNTKIENIVTEDMKYHEMAVFHILLQSVVLCKHWNWCSVIQCFS